MTHKRIGGGELLAMHPDRLLLDFGPVIPRAALALVVDIAVEAAEARLEYFTGFIGRRQPVLAERPQLQREHVPQGHAHALIRLVPQVGGVRVVKKYIYKRPFVRVVARVVVRVVQEDFDQFARKLFVNLAVRPTQIC